MVATLNGSWSNRLKKGGIGGIIKDKNRKLKVLFSGPAFFTDSFFIELEALKLILSIWSYSHFSSASISIFSDCKQAIDEFKEYFTLQKRDSKTGLMLTDLDLNPMGLCLKHIKR